MRRSAEVREVIVVVPCPFYLNGVAEWLSGNRSQEIVWDATTNDDVIYHSVKLQNPEGVQRDLLSSRMGHFALCHEEREWR